MTKTILLELLDSSLENIKDDTHYFTMTAKKDSLIWKEVIMGVSCDNLGLGYISARLKVAQLSFLMQLNSQLTQLTQLRITNNEQGYKIN